MDPPVAQNRPGNIDGVSGNAHGRPLPTRGAHPFRQVNAQAGPSSRLAHLAMTRDEYPTPPPTYSSPAPAPGPALPATAPTQLSPAVILDRISQQLADNHDELVQHMNDNFRLVNEHLGEMNETMAQIRDTSFDTLSESFHSADEEVLALSDAGTPSAPTANSDGRAVNAGSTQPEPPADSETYSSMYASSEPATQHDSVPLGPPSMIAGADSSLPSAAAGHSRLPLSLQPSVDLREEDGDAPVVRPLRRRPAFRSLSLPVDDASNAAAGTGQDTLPTLDANRVFSRPASPVDADVDQETGGQGPTEPLEVPPPALNATAIGDHDAAALNTRTGLADNPVLTLVGCRATSELCPGTLQLVIDVGTDRQVSNADHLFFVGDLGQAIQQLPAICAEREIEWSQLYLRIRAPVYRRQDAMLKVMHGLRSHLHCFIGLHLVMDEEILCIGMQERASFQDAFARLLFLSVEGEVTLDRLLLFPLYNLRHLAIKSKIDAADISEILCRAKMLDIFQFNNRGCSQRARGTHLAEISPYASIPSAMYIEADYPAAFLSLLRAAESTTTDLRLAVNSGSVSSQIRDLFDHHPGWKLVS
ncbi:hypothetical protein K523DRAFT_375575 [Schizophyllum commune Tattone D]|nr:hypothetical protein K523DRAFT_375575 [Schizophyllum commune Tattone D]